MPEEHNSDEIEMTAYACLAQKVKNAKRQWEEAICEDEAPPDKAKKSIGVDEEYPTSQRRGTAIIANYMEDDWLMTFDVNAEDSFFNSEEESGSEQDSEENGIGVGQRGEVDQEAPTPHCSQTLQLGEVVAPNEPQISQGANNSNVRL